MSERSLKTVDLHIMNEIHRALNQVGMRRQLFQPQQGLQSLNFIGSLWDLGIVSDVFA